MPFQRFALLALLVAAPVAAQEADFPILFTNVHVFDGVNEERIENANVLVVDNLIADVSAEPLAAANARIIDGGGRTLMPGIIEAHGHLGLPVPPGRLMGDEHWQYVAAKSTEDAKFYLDHGWTTVRDVGGPVIGLKKAIDEGAVPGPRVYPSGMFISQTSGHGDFRRFADQHPNQSPSLPDFNRYYGHIADGVPEVLRATREELRKGSVHIKMMAGGGVASQYDPLHTTQYSLEEMQAVVGAAADWGTYVMVHAYTDQAIARAIEAGVKVIEHGQLMTEDTARLMARRGVWLSTQAELATGTEGEAIVKAMGPVTYGKWLQVKEGFDRSISYAKKHDVNIAFGTDLFGDALPMLTNEFRARQPYFTNIEILRQATSGNGELLKLTGILNPYPDGPLGVIQPGAYADILLVDGDPIEDLLLLTDPANISFVMKDGKIQKNTL